MFCKKFLSYILKKYICLYSTYSSFLVINVNIRETEFISLFTNLILSHFCSILYVHIVHPIPGPAILPRGEYNSKFLESCGARTLFYTHASFNSYTVILHIYIHILSAYEIVYLRTHTFILIHLLTYTSVHTCTYTYAHAHMISYTYACVHSYTDTCN